MNTTVKFSMDMKLCSKRITVWTSECENFNIYKRNKLNVVGEKEYDYVAYTNEKKFGGIFLGHTETFEEIVKVCQRRYEDILQEQYRQFLNTI